MGLGITNDTMILSFPKYCLLFMLKQTFTNCDFRIQSLKTNLGKFKTLQKVPKFFSVTQLAKISILSSSLKIKQTTKYSASVQISQVTDSRHEFK